MVKLQMGEIHALLSTGVWLHRDLQIESCRRGFLGKLWVWLQKVIGWSRGYQLAQVSESILRQLSMPSNHPQSLKDSIAVLTQLQQKFTRCQSSEMLVLAHRIEKQRIERMQKLAQIKIESSSKALSGSSDSLSAAAPSLEPKQSHYSVKEAASSLPPIGSSYEEASYGTKNTSVASHTVASHTVASHTVADNTGENGGALAELKKPQMPSPTTISSLEKGFSNFKSARERLIRWVSLSQPKYRPRQNGKVLLDYIGTELYLDQVKTAKVYYNASEMSAQDAQCAIAFREPSNIEMSRQYDISSLKQLYGYETSPYCSGEFLKMNGESFLHLPSTACIYSEVSLWSTPGMANTIKEVACLSVPAPLLTTPKQPHYSYYIDPQGRLKADRYRKEMLYLAKAIVQCALDHRRTAFEGDGIQRIIIPMYGQDASLSALKLADQAIARAIFFETLIETITSLGQELKELKIMIWRDNHHSNGEILDAFMNPLNIQGFDVNVINGDLLNLAHELDLIINTWDSYSAPGNGNDADSSVNGVMGKGSSILATQLPMINTHLMKLPTDEVYRAVNP